MLCKLFSILMLYRRCIHGMRRKVFSISEDQVPILLFFQPNLRIAPSLATLSRCFSVASLPRFELRSDWVAFLFPPQQQTPQQVPTWNKNPMRLKAEAIHMNTSIGTPSSALMFSSGADRKTLRKMVNMTVATTLAPAVRIRVTSVKIMSGISRRNIFRPRCDHRGSLLKPRGARKMARNVNTVPAMKQPNIQLLATLTMAKASVTSPGNAIVAPASNSLTRMSTGLNQYSR